MSAECDTMDGKSGAEPQLTEFVIGEHILKSNCPIVYRQHLRSKGQLQLIHKQRGK